MTPVLENTPEKQNDQYLTMDKIISNENNFISNDSVATGIAENRNSHL